MLYNVMWFVLIVVLILAGILIVTSNSFQERIHEKPVEKDELEDKIIYKEHNEEVSNKYYLVTYGTKEDKKYEVSEEEFNKYDIMDEYLPENKEK